MAHGHSRNYTTLTDATQTLVEPKRSKQFDKRTEPFVHHTRQGLVFELWPNEYVDRVIAVEGIFERRFVSYLNSVLPRDAVMLDIGANIGNHAIFLAEGCREIHCFEPNPKVAERLRRNIAHNDLNDRISVYEFGLGDRDEVLTFAENSEGNLGASRFIRFGEEVKNNHRIMKLEVKCAASAIEALNLDRIDFIKIDVEGMEEAVLTALNEIIAKYRPIVAFEHHEHLASKGTFARIRNLFEDYRLMEPCFAPDESARNKILWNLRHDGGPLLIEVVEPECRTYDNILAFPDAGQLHYHPNQAQKHLRTSHND